MMKDIWENNWSHFVKIREAIKTAAHSDQRNTIFSLFSMTFSPLGAEKHLDFGQKRMIQSTLQFICVSTNACACVYADKSVAYGKFMEGWTIPGTWNYLLQQCQSSAMKPLINTIMLHLAHRGPRSASSPEPLGSLVGQWDWASDQMVCGCWQLISVVKLHWWKGLLPFKVMLSRSNA